MHMRKMGKRQIRGIGTLIEQKRFSNDTAKSRNILATVAPLLIHGQDWRKRGLDHFLSKDLACQQSHLDPAQCLQVAETVEQIGDCDRQLTQISWVTRFVHRKKVGLRGTEHLEPGLILPGPERTAIASAHPQIQIQRVRLEPLLAFHYSESIL